MRKKTNSKIKSKVDEVIEVFDFNTKENVNGTITEVSLKTGVTSAVLKRLLSGKMKIAKSIALSDFKVKVYDYKGNTLNESVTSLMRVTGLDLTSVSRLVNNKKLAIKGYSLSKSSLVAAAEKNVKYQSLTLYNLDSTVIVGFFDELIERAGINSNSLRKLVSNDSKIIKGWSANESAIKEYNSKHNNTLYKFDGDDVISVSSNKKEELSNKTGLSQFVIEKLKSTPGECVNGWAYSEDAAKSMIEANIYDREEMKKKVINVFDFNSDKVLSGTMDEIVAITGVSKTALKNLVSGEVKFAKHIALSDFKVKLYDYKGSVLNKSVTEIMKATGLDLMSVNRLVQNSHLVIGGYSLSMKALNDEAKTNIKFQRFSLYGLDGEVLEDFYDELIELSGINTASLRKLVNDESKIIKGWSAKKSYIEDYKTRTHIKMYKFDGEKVISVKAGKEDMSKKTGLSTFLITRLASFPGKCINGWAYSEDDAKGLVEAKIPDRAKAFDKSRLITLMVNDGKGNIGKTSGYLDDLIVKYSIPNLKFRQLLYGNAEVYVDKESLMKFSILEIEPEKIDVSEVDTVIAKEA